MTLSTTAHKNSKALKTVIKTALTVLFWLGLWQFLYFIVDNDVLIASPQQVGKRLLELLPDIKFHSAVLHSFLRIAAGYAAGVALGTALAVMTSFSEILSAILKPFLTAVKTTPVVSFIILALVWLPKVRIPVFITALMVMPLVWANVASGILSTDRELIEMANSYNFGFMKKLKLIYLPSSVPSFITACETAVGMGWKAGIAAEVLCTPAVSIGINLKNSQVYIETADLFAWTAVIIVLSLILEKALVAALGFVFKKFVKKAGYYIENID